MPIITKGHAGFGKKFIKLQFSTLFNNRFFFFLLNLAQLFFFYHPQEPVNELKIIEVKLIRNYLIKLIIERVWS